MNKTKSKIYLNSFFTICLLSTLTFGQSQDSTLKIRNLKDRYSKKEKILFNVENISSDTIYVKIGAEEHKNNKWIILTEDIFKDQISKTSMFISLKPHTAEEIVWEPHGEIFDNNVVKFEKIKIKGKYRFFLFWSNNPKFFKNKCITSAFIKM